MIRQALFTWIGASAIAAVLCFADAQLPAPVPLASDPVAGAVAASQLADLEACQTLHGPNAAAVQLPDGQHRCTDKHGRRLSDKSAITIAAHGAPR